MAKYDYLGFGLGLRSPHVEEIMADKPDVDWFEIISENYFESGGKKLFLLEKIREDYPIVMHGVSMSLGSTGPLDWDYLKQLERLIDRIQPAWISDHLCWTGVNGRNTHDLMPLPYTQEALDNIVDRMQQVQEFLGRQMLLENPSSYVTYKESTLTEWDFMTQLAERADCLLLFDVNNIFVSGFNHDFDPQDYLKGTPAERVQQFHLAGHTNNGTHIVDTHDHDVIDEVWDLYRDAIRRFGKVSTMIERDDHIPPFKDLYEELQQAKRIAEEVWAEDKVVAQEKKEVAA